MVWEGICPGARPMSGTPPATNAFKLCLNGLGGFPIRQAVWSGNGRRREAVHLIGFPTRACMNPEPLRGRGNLEAG